jgi:hypothetical protein
MGSLWSGDYTCENECNGTPNGEEGGDIEITILQAGETAVYIDDGDAIYFGSVCGTDFRHLGGQLGYWEYGVLSRTSETTATKESTWVSNLFGGEDCGGLCSDELTLVDP